MTVTADRLQRVVQTVWTTQLGLALEADDASRVRADLDEREAVLTVVRFRGGFEGALAQRCSRRLSELAAAAAFSPAEPAIGPAEHRDTLAELAHMTAGNLKSLLPSPCEVSLPETAATEAPRGEVIAEVGFRLAGEPLTVALARARDH